MAACVLYVYQSLFHRAFNWILTVILIQWFWFVGRRSISLYGWLMLLISVSECRPPVLPFHEFYLPLHCCGVVLGSHCCCVLLQQEELKSCVHFQIQKLLSANWQKLKWKTCHNKNLGFQIWNKLWNLYFKINLNSMEVGVLRKSWCRDNH